MAGWKRRLAEERERRNKGEEREFKKRKIEDGMNKGVAERDAKDRKELVLKDREESSTKEALMRKVEEYERIMNGERDDELLDLENANEKLVNFVPKRYNAIIQQENQKDNQVAKSFFTEDAVASLFVSFIRIFMFVCL